MNADGVPDGMEATAYPRGTKYERLIQAVLDPEWQLIKPDNICDYRVTPYCLNRFHTHRDDGMHRAAKMYASEGWRTDIGFEEIKPYKEVVE